MRFLSVMLQSVRRFRDLKNNTLLIVFHNDMKVNMKWYFIRAKMQILCLKNFQHSDIMEMDTRANAKKRLCMKSLQHQHYIEEGLWCLRSWLQTDMSPQMKTTILPCHPLTSNQLICKYHYIITVELWLHPNLIYNMLVFIW